MINITTAAFLADVEGYLKQANSGELLRIARPGQGSLILMGAGVFKDLETRGVKFYGPGERLPDDDERTERYERTIRELDKLEE